MRRPRFIPTVLLVLVALTGLLAEPVHAYRLSTRDLRTLGYFGTYRGFLEGNLGTWNGVSYDETGIGGPAVESIGVPLRKVVTGPGGRNGFYLTRVSANGNLRRATIRYTYSGTSFNPDFGETMYGSGQKTVRLVRRGFSRIRYEITTSDVFEERSVFDGSLFTFWRLSGSYAR
jgi:hypothetical protein